MRRAIARSPTSPARLRSRCGNEPGRPRTSRLQPSIAKYIDASRSAACASETNAATPCDDEYHAVLRGFVDEIRPENAETGLLLDLHGSKRRLDAPADIYVGTENGLTITALRAGTSDDALYQRRDLVGPPQATGHTVLPGEAGVPEHPDFNGAYIVETYGGHQADGIDAIQLEIAAELRTYASRRAALATDLADALASLMPRWLPSPMRGASA
jgi:hypothetical protein